jgi:hypothetical protein
MNSGPLSTPPDECETCGNPEGVFCDECRLEEHLADIERAERLREEDVFLYSVPLRTGNIV